jgi:hypothetical protein
MLWRILKSRLVFGVIIADGKGAWNSLLLITEPMLGLCSWNARNGRSPLPYEN